MTSLDYLERIKSNTKQTNLNEATNEVKKWAQWKCKDAQTRIPGNGIHISWKQKLAFFQTWKMWKMTHQNGFLKK